MTQEIVPYQRQSMATPLPYTLQSSHASPSPDILPNGWQSSTRPLPYRLQPVQQPILPALPEHPIRPDPVGYQMAHKSGSTSNVGTYLLVIGLLGGALFGGGVMAMIAVSRPDTVSPVINNPPANIYNPNCKLFCSR